MFHSETDKLAGGVRSTKTTRSQIALQGQKYRSCELWSKETVKNQHINEKENILLKSCTTQVVRNYNQKSPDKLDMGFPYILEDSWHSSGNCIYSGFQILRNTMWRCCQAYLPTSVCNFEHFLFVQFFNKMFSV